MRNTLYYGEIAAKISAHLYQNPDHIIRIDESMKREQHSDTIWTICADAARVFDTIEDLSGEHFVDWHRALDYYAKEVMEALLRGHKPYIVDMVSMASHSIQIVR